MTRKTWRSLISENRRLCASKYDVQSLYPLEVRIPASVLFVLVVLLATALSLSNEARAYVCVPLALPSIPIDAMPGDELEARFSGSEVITPQNIKETPIGDLTPKQATLFRQIDPATCIQFDEGVDRLYRVVPMFPGLVPEKPFQVLFSWTPGRTCIRYSSCLVVFSWGEDHDILLTSNSDLHCGSFTTRDGVARPACRIDGAPWITRYFIWGAQGPTLVLEQHFILKPRRF
jgi:hypothetical protein